MGLHLKYDSVLFLFIHGLRVQYSIRVRKSTIYFYQDVQAFGGTKYNFVQLIK